VVSAREPYRRFATYYDFIYHGLVNYQGDVNFLEAIFRRELRTPPRDILDLGCGTGNHDLALAKRGYQVTGLDRSSSQLSIARRKARAARAQVRFVRGDMRAFDLGRTFDAAVCMFGAFGYLTQKSDAVRCLKAVHRHLRVGGLFVYEFWHTPAVSPRDDWFYKVGPRYGLVRLGHGRFDVRTRVLSVEYHFFAFSGRRVLDRFSETHALRTYTVSEMRGILSRGGFRLIAAYAATPQKKTFRPVRRDTFRVMVVARRR